MPKPVAKANLIHQQILGGLIASKPVSWVHKALIEGFKPGTVEVVKTKVTHQSLVNPLAANVSEATINQMAARWGA